MKILVTGGCGFIGSAFVRKALSIGYSVVNIDSLTYAGSLKNLEKENQSKLYKFFKTDIRNLDQVNSIFEETQPDKVIHLAAESHVDRSIEAPIDFLETNVLGTYNMLEASLKHYNRSKKNKFIFHHVSTDEVYGSLGSTGLFSEETPYSPNSPYSASKASSDHFVRAWHETFGLPIVITNCSNNYGPFQFPEKLIPLIILNALNKKPIEIYGDGSNIRDWLHVYDHVDALIEVLNNGINGRTYNIGGHNEVKNIDIALKICSILDKKIPSNNPYSDLITFVDDRPGHDKRYAIDASRIKNELNWTPKYTIESGINQTIDWYLNNVEWLNHIKSENIGDRLGLIK